MIWNIRKHITSNQNNKKNELKKSEDSISSLCDYIKRSNICIIGVPEEEKEQETGNLYENIRKKTPLIW